MDISSQKEILAFQAQRTINALCKNFLNVLEDLVEEYDRCLNNAAYRAGELPENFLTERHFSYLRKKVLDRGGDAARDLLQEIEKYNVALAANPVTRNESE